MPFLLPILFVSMHFLAYYFSMADVYDCGCDFHCNNERINASTRSTDRTDLHNWGHSVNFSAKVIEYPSTIEEVRKVVCCARKIRVAGSKHSFNAIDNTPGTLLGTQKLNKILAIDPKVPSVTVQSGITYTDLDPALYSAGFALPIVASETGISVGGATQTGAHGSGLENQNLATQIRSLQIVLANGSLVTFGQNDEELKAVAVGLGSFGVITQIELNLIPAFNVTTHVFIAMPIQNVYDHFDEIQNLGYSVKMYYKFTDPESLWSQIWIYQLSNAKTNVSNLQTLYGANRSQDPSIVQNKEQPWHVGLTVKSQSNNTNAQEIDCEYFIPYKNAVSAIKAVLALRDRIYPLAQNILLRTVTGDDIWLSEVYGNEQSKFLIINFVFLTANESAVAEKLTLIESTLLQFEARPHWGKFFTMTPKDYLKYHPKLDAFRQLSDQLDPNHKFRNEFVTEKVFQGQITQNAKPPVLDS